MAKENQDSSQKSNNYIGAFFCSLIGVIAGFYTIKFLISHGYNSVGPIGFFVGIFSLVFIKRRSNLFGIWCLILALSTSLYAELHFFHSSLSINAFLQNLSELPFKTKATIVFCALVAFYFGRGRDKKSKDSSDE